MEIETTTLIVFSFVLQFQNTGIIFCYIYESFYSTLEIIDK
jgi:hypothetical protein